MYRPFCLIFSLVLLVSVGCQQATPPTLPTNTPPAATAEPIPTLAKTPTIPAPNTAVPTEPPITTPPPTAVPDTDDLLAIVQADLPANAFDGVTVMPLYAPESERRLWAVHSTGFRNFDLDPLPNHFLAIYTYEDGSWLELARENLNPDTVEFYASPDILPEQGVNQVDVNQAYIWLAVDGNVGAHGGTFQLYRFDGATLHLEAAASSDSPGVGYLEDLNDDGRPELILRLHDYYVFCYACGVRNLYFQVLTWDAVNERMLEVSIQPMLMGQQGHPARPFTNRAVELANAGLWLDALIQIEAAEQIAAQTAEPTDTFILEWDAALIRFYNDAWQAELGHSPYPLLTHIFRGDYGAAIDIMRNEPPDQIFNNGTPLIRGTVAEGNEQWLASYLLGQVNPTITVQPNLAAAYYLRAWATFLQNPANPQIRSDLAQAAALDPAEPLYSQTIVPAVDRIQFAPGATDAEISGQVAAGETAVYVLGAQAGQQMRIDLMTQDETARLEVQDSEGGWLDGQVTPTLWQGQLPATADYVIRVHGGDALADYTLLVIIPIRIQFAPGATTASMTGDLDPFQAHDYILSAQAGQTMAVTIHSAAEDILLTLVGEDGIPLANGLMSGATSWRGQLPATQDYFIRVLGTELGGSYTLDVTIE
jgi:hypothetical protein